MTSEAFQTHPIGRFTPPSIGDFVERARNVSRFLDMPRRRSEERLAALYGYGSAHEIRRAIMHAAASGQEPGPYDSETLNEILGRQPQRISGPITVDRGSACLDMAKEATGCAQANEMSARAWAFRDIGLFDEMGRHRSKMRQNTIAQDTIDVIEGRSTPSEALVPMRPHDYATVEFGVTGRVRLRFTDLGEGLSEAISTAMHPDTTPFYHDRDARLEMLQRMHPENPYVHAARSVNDCYAIHNGHPDPRVMMRKAIEHYDAAVPLFDVLYADAPTGTLHDATESRSFMTPFRMEDSGMRIMCEHLLLASRTAHVTTRSTDLRKRLTYFNVSPEGRDIHVD